MADQILTIGIIGYGKMGKEIEAYLDHNTNHKHVIFNTLHDLTEVSLKDLNVAIEFTNPESALRNISSCLKAGIPVISGTTGWLSDKPFIDKLCTDMGGAFLYASNFSPGMNLVFELNRQMARLMNTFPQFKPAIVEIHHTQKLDKPSGTALTLAEGVIDNLDSQSSWHSSGETGPGLPITAIRQEGVKGIHKIEYSSPTEFIELKHQAFSREVFAAGAVLAAEWIIGKQGVFTFSDIFRSISN